MSSQTTFLGYDPGGERAFGVACLVGQLVTFSTVSSVDEAIEWTIASLKQVSSPSAAGIDTLLQWSSSVGGNRSAEWILRKRYPDASLSIISPNSLAGSMAIGGMALAFRLRSIYPSIPLNETHPKLLARHFNGVLPKGAEARTKERRNWMATQLTGRNINISNDHEVDAIVSAWATREALTSLEKPRRSWQDLYAENSNAISPITDVHYYWPD